MSANDVTTLRCTVLDPQGPGRGDVVITIRPERPVLHQFQMQGSSALSIGCRGGGCGVCRVEVVVGDYEAKRMSKKFISDADLANGVVLACRILPITDLVIRPARLPGDTGDIVIT